MITTRTHRAGRTLRFGIAAAAIGLTLAACGGVDREGTRDELVKQLEANGIDIDADCVDTALDKYSDDELKKIDDALGNGENTAASDALFAELISCIPTGG
jgi:hypothetical protein